MISLDEVVQFLDQFFYRQQYPNDPSGIYRYADQPIRRIGLALEPFSDLQAWVDQHQIDALFLHRPWKLEDEMLSPSVGVFFYHLAFDERLTLGLNSRLAEALSLVNIKAFGEKEGRAIGMIGEISARSFDYYRQQIHQIFGGDEAGVYSASKSTLLSRIAIVGAMTDPLIREAADDSVDLYVTGQFREVAKQAVVETGMEVIAIGHRRCELWGLRALAGVLRERWAELQVFVREKY